jgi:K+-sensing histidine kinase KdpD
LFLGISGSITSVVFSTLAADYFFMEPRGSLLVRTPDDFISLVIFVINCVLISTLVLAHNHHRERVDHLISENELIQERLRLAESLSILANKLKLS